MSTDTKEECLHLNFEDLTLHGEKTTVEYMCTECKKWFSHREKTRIVMRRDIAEKNKVNAEDALDSVVSETQCKITEDMSISKTDLYHLHRESSEVYPDVYRNMSSFEKGLIEKLVQLDKRIQELEELLGGKKQRMKRTYLYERQQTKTNRP